MLEVIGGGRIKVGESGRTVAVAHSRVCQIVHADWLQIFVVARDNVQPQFSAPVVKFDLIKMSFITKYAYSGAPNGQPLLNLKQKLAFFGRSRCMRVQCWTRTHFLPQINSEL